MLVVHLEQHEVILNNSAKLHRCCLICQLISLAFWLVLLSILVHVGTLLFSMGFANVP